MRKYIVSNPDILGGAPVIKGTRIPIEVILHRLKEGNSLEAIHKMYGWVDMKTLAGAVEEVIETVTTTLHAYPSHCERGRFFHHSPPLALSDRLTTLQPRYPEYRKIKRPFPPTAAGVCPQKDMLRANSMTGRPPGSPSGVNLTAASAKLGYDRGGKGVRQVASEALIIRRAARRSWRNALRCSPDAEAAVGSRHSQEGLPAGLEGRKMLACVYRVTVSS